jgi:uncharacterized protein YjiS (DUF1127 family)
MTTTLTTDTVVTLASGTAPVKPAVVPAYGEIQAIARRAHAERSAAIAEALANGIVYLTVAAKKAYAGWTEARRQAQGVAELRGLDDRMLHDIGVDRGGIYAAVATASGRHMMPNFIGMESYPVNDNLISKTA